LIRTREKERERERLTDVVELVGELWQQEAGEDFESCRLIDFSLKLEQRLNLVLTKPDCFEATRAEGQRQVL